MVTDVAKDGMLAGPNLDLLRSSAPHATRRSSPPAGSPALEDLAAIATLVDDGVEGAIVGTALYAGSLAIADALVAAPGR